MFPIIRNGDLVAVEPIEGDPGPGDIVLAVIGGRSGQRQVDQPAGSDDCSALRLLRSSALAALGLTVSTFTPMSPSAEVTVTGSSASAVTSPGLRSRTRGSNGSTTTTSASS